MMSVVGSVVGFCFGVRASIWMYGHPDHHGKFTKQEYEYLKTKYNQRQMEGIDVEGEIIEKPKGMYVWSKI